MFNRHFRFGSIFVAAALALSVVGASSASAAAYKVESVPAFVKGVGEGSQVFKAGTTITCTNKENRGQLAAVTSTTLTVTSSYSGCTFGGQAVTVAMNGCTFKFGEPTGTASPFTIKTVTIECPTGKEIVLTATTSGCTIKFKAQTTTGTSTATNVGTGAARSVTFAWNVSNIVYTGSGGICGGSGTTGAYNGKEAMKAYTNEAFTKQQGFFIG